MKGQYQIAAEESTQDQDPLNKVIEDIEGEDGPMNGELQSHDPSRILYLFFLIYFINGSALNLWITWENE